MDAETSQMSAVGALDYIHPNDWIAGTLLRSLERAPMYNVEPLIGHKLLWELGIDYMRYIDMNINSAPNHSKWPDPTKEPYEYAEAKRLLGTIPKFKFVLDLHSSMDIGDAIMYSEEATPLVRGVASYITELVGGGNRAILAPKGGLHDLSPNMLLWDIGLSPDRKKPFARIK